MSFSYITDFDLLSFIKTAGYVGLFVIVFIESGVFFGFFFPGDSLIFTAGLLASQGYFNIYILVATILCATILGEMFGYWFGEKIGVTIFTREDSRFFKKKHIEKASLFFNKYGARTILLARFIPVVRTFAPILAGVGKMDYKIFMRYNLIGATLWGAGLPFLALFLGNVLPEIDRFLMPIIGLIIFISFLPVIFSWQKK